MTADIDLPGLAACPFCGGEAELKPGYPFNMVKCEGCGARILTSDDATAKWNTRAASAPDGVVGEPCAWLQSQNGVEIVSKHRLDEKAFEYGWTERPLYAAPQSFTSGHVAGQREMQERAKAVADGFNRPFESVHDDCVEEVDGIRSGARMIASAIASLPVRAGEESASGFLAPHNHGESDLVVTQDCPEADTRASALTAGEKAAAVADRKMTREEYDRFTISGWHLVRHDGDAEGITEVCYQPTTPATSRDRLATPPDCIDRGDCMLRRVPTEPDIGLVVCHKPRCPHSICAFQFGGSHE